MSFGGSVAAMISSLKMNSRRKPPPHLQDIDRSRYKRNTDLGNLLKRKATPEQIEAIHRRAKRENRRYLTISALVILLSIGIIVELIRFLVFSKFP